MKYYILKSGKWERAHQYNLKDMRQIKLYDLDKNEVMQCIGIGLY